MLVTLLFLGVVAFTIIFMCSLFTVDMDDETDNYEEEDSDVG